MIELLVVIAIIALLVSILMPSLTQAKALARAAVCRSNLRLVGIALPQYVMENDDFLPPYNDPHNSSQPPFFSAGDPFIGPDGLTYTKWRKYVMYSEWFTASGSHHIPRGGSGFLSPYLGTETHGDVGCPEVPPGPESRVYMRNGTATVYAIYRLKSFGVNFAYVVTMTPAARQYDPMPYNRILRPAELVYACDTCGRGSHVRAGLYDTPDNCTADVPTPRHFDAFNMVFCDGHADGGTWEQFYNEMYFEEDRG